MKQYYINEELTNSVPEINRHYKGTDLEVFKKQENWHKWQQALFAKICDKSGDIRPVSSKNIICVQDPVLLENSETTYFFKYLLYKYPNFKQELYDLIS